MITARKFFCLAAACLLLPACASVPMTAERPAQGAYRDINAAYVNSVERGARIRGTTVIWVNPPREADTSN
jgi:starvation-inducible outer membrane lipoprotein